jgi:hypothetical protein
MLHCTLLARHLTIVFTQQAISIRDPLSTLVWSIRECLCVGYQQSSGALIERRCFYLISIHWPSSLVHEFIFAKIAQRQMRAPFAVVVRASLKFV